MRVSESSKILFAAFVLFFLSSGFALGQSADSLMVDQTGRVGIGTTNPVRKFNVYDNAANNWVAQFSNSASSSHGVYINTGGNWSTTSYPFAVGSYDLSTLLFQIRGDGKLYSEAALNYDYVARFGNRGGAGGGVLISAGGISSDHYPLVVNPYNNAINLMYIRGDGLGYLASSGWLYGSDERLKENISYFSDGLETISKLKPARFGYREGQKNQMGFIAQDVQKVIPEAVEVVNKETGMLGLKSDFIVPYLVNAVQELKVENDDLRARISALEKRVK